MANIFQGDNGTVLGLTVKDENGPIDITGASVTVNFKTSTRTFTKTASITDSATGACEVVLLSEDLSETGFYSFQGEVTFVNGNKFASDVQKFLVGGRI